MLLPDPPRTSGSSLSTVSIMPFRATPCIPGRSFSRHGSGRIHPTSENLASRKVISTILHSRAPFRVEVSPDQVQRMLGHPETPCYTLSDRYSLSLSLEISGRRAPQDGRTPVLRFRALITEGTAQQVEFVRA